MKHPSETVQPRTSIGRAPSQRRGRRIASVGLALAVAAAVVACGGDDDGPDPAVVDFLIEQGESQEAADCFAKELSKYSLSDFEGLLLAESPEDVDEQFFEDIDKASDTVCADL